MINILQTIKNLPKLETEGNRFHIRFMDLNDNIQNKFVATIKNISRLQTIKNNEKISSNRIKEILEDCNPVLYSPNIHCPNWSFFRWKEKNISSLIYHIWRIDDKHYKPQTRTIRHLINHTIRPEILLN